MYIFICNIQIMGMEIYTLQCMTQVSRERWLHSFLDSDLVSKLLEESWGFVWGFFVGFWFGFNYMLCC